MQSTLTCFTSAELAGLSYSKNVSSASFRANALSCGSSILQCNLLRVINFYLGPALNAVRFHISLLVRTNYITYIIHIFMCNATLFLPYIVLSFQIGLAIYGILALEGPNYHLPRLKKYFCNTTATSF